MNRTALCSLLVLLSLAPAAESAEPAVPIPAPDQILSTLRKEHPRLLATTEDFASLKQRVATDPTLKKWHEALKAEATRLLTAPPSKYEIPDGLRLLATSRRVLDRVLTLALIHRLDGDPRFAARAWTELDAAAQFKDWNPRHFLDTAEMTHAFAIGYDWLYDVWTAEQRAVLRKAMVELGLNEAWKIYAADRWWAKAHHNWNQVCNGGIGMGALALADVEPELAGRILNAGMKSIQLAMVEYGPDGAWAEGPGYWNYATRYNVAILAALQTALGTDFGLSRIPGFSEAGMFPIYAVGTTGRSFSYADAHAGPIRAAEMFWLARQFQRPAYAAYELERAAPQPLDLLWGDTRAPATALTALPLDKHFRHADVVMLRSAWNDPQGVFVGFKAGDNAANHSHLDLGSFVLDALGERWAEDIGSDDYNLPGYFGDKRWTYYRLRAEGHNTLVINPGTEPDQPPRAVAPITRFESKTAKAFAIADLSAAYEKQARKVERGVALLDRKTVLVQDEIAAAAPATVWWFLHTPAKIELSPDARTVTLKIGAARLLAVLQSPVNARFTEMKAEPLASSPQPPRHANNRSISKLAVQVQEAGDLRLAVYFVPLKPGEAAPAQLAEVRPLANW